ncbi:MAG: VOC family protein [Proteobacteria bacterium]|nr:VOC family protein [Pseudomonadota bacterium]
MASLFPDICTEDVAAARDFYTRLLGLKAVFENDWYVQLQDPEDPSLQLAFVKRDHPSVPEGHRDSARGVIVTIEVDQVDPVFERAERLGVPIVQTLRDEAWGQRHFMAQDPTGLLLDVVQLIPPSGEYAQG